MLQRLLNDVKLEALFRVVLLTCIITLRGNVLGECSDLCEWTHWRSWSPECPNCGYTPQWRSRGLCCREDWVEQDTCETNCGKDISGYSEHRYCTIECLNGGTSHTDFCQCVDGYSGTCCDITQCQTAIKTTAATDIDECACSPCHNGATCIDKENSFICECPRVYGDLCETGICQPSVADVVFILDSSISQTEQEFRKQLEFINSFIDVIVIGEDNLRIAVITYSFEAVVEMQFGDFMAKDLLKHEVNAIEYKPGATFTHRGLQAASEIFGNSFVPRRNGKRGRRFAFLLTDGMSNDGKKTIAAANQLKSVVETVVSTGVGQEVSHEELLNIASVDGSRHYVYSVESFNALYTVLQQLVHLTCDECEWKTYSNVVFLLDSSKTMTSKDFQIGLDALVYLTQAIIERETDNVTANVALVTFGRDLKFHRGLNDTTPKSLLLPQIQKLILPVDDSCLKDEDCLSISSLDQALENLKTEVLDCSTHEEEKNTVIIILSNGQLSVNTRATEQLKHFNEGRISSYAIGLGSLVNLENLKQLVEDPAMVFALVDRANMSTLDALTSEIFVSSCNLSNDFVSNS